jgi:hypothetical protein
MRTGLTGDVKNIWTGSIYGVCRYWSSKIIHRYSCEVTVKRGAGPARTLCGRHCDDYLRQANEAWQDDKIERCSFCERSAK